jgi:hypothetical protein
MQQQEYSIGMSDVSPDHEDKKEHIHTHPDTNVRISSPHTGHSPDQDLSHGSAL